MGDNEKNQNQVPSEEALSKAISAAAQVLNNTPEARRQELFAKGQKGALTADESAELARLLSGATAGNGLSSQVAALTEPGANPNIEKAVKMNGFLEDFHTSFTASLKLVADTIEKSQAKGLEQQGVLAKALYDMGQVQLEVLKQQRQLAEMMTRVLQQPARDPKGVSVAGGAPAQAPGGQIVKALGPGQQSAAQDGQRVGLPVAPAPNQISRGEVLGLLTEMNMASKDGLSKSGVNIAEAVTGFETGQGLPRPLLSELIAYRRDRLSGKVQPPAAAL